MALLDGCIPGAAKEKRMTTQHKETILGEKRPIETA